MLCALSPLFASWLGFYALFHYDLWLVFKHKNPKFPVIAKSLCIGIYCLVPYKQSDKKIYYWKNYFKLDRITSQTKSVNSGFLKTCNKELTLKINSIISDLGIRKNFHGDWYIFLLLPEHVAILMDQQLSQGSADGS